MRKNHILIMGERNSGKTTLIYKLLEKNTRPLSGFFTRANETRPDGFHEIYIHPAKDRYSECTEENHMADCNKVDHIIHPEVFDKFGTACLTHNCEDLIVMDELGFMESKSEVFCDTVLSCLDGDVPVLGTVKSGHDDVDFLNRIKHHPKVTLYKLTGDNFDELYDKILPRILKWNNI